MSISLSREITMQNGQQSVTLCKFTYINPGVPPTSSLSAQNFESGMYQFLWMRPFSSLTRLRSGNTYLSSDSDCDCCRLWPLGCLFSEAGTGTGAGSSESSLS